MARVLSGTSELCSLSTRQWDRLSEAIIKAGMQLFAVIDHAANARAAGLEMPPSTVLIYGKAEGGTMIMLASPASALDLPLRVLVRQDADGRTIMAFHPVAPMLRPMGFPRRWRRDSSRRKTCSAKRLAGNPACSISPASSSAMVRPIWGWMVS
jgi:hypothetical protein